MRREEADPASAPLAPTPPAGDLSGWETQVRKGGLGLAVLAILWPGRLYGLEILKRLDADAGMSIPEGPSIRC